jgi:hypothetical protein
MKQVMCCGDSKVSNMTYLQKSAIAIRHFGALLFALLALSVSAQAQVTSLTLSSDPGDYIGGGQFYYFTPYDGSFGAYPYSYDGVSLNGVALSFSSNSHWFWLYFYAPNNQPLTIGTYTGASKAGAANEPYLDISGDGRGCSTVSGSFQVLEVTYDANNILQAFDATFEQHCEGLTPALRGEIRYNASGIGVVVNVTAPTHQTVIENQNLNFAVTATDAQSRPVVLTATGLPAGASFVDNGDNTGTFDWTPTNSQAGTYLLTFQGDNQQGNTAVTYTQVVVIPPPPPNDDFDQPTIIPSIPFTVNEDAANATIAPDDPYCYGANQTVWFAYTPESNIRLEANNFGSNYYSALSVYTGARGSLNQIACNLFSGGSSNSRVRFDAVAGTTYYFAVSSLYPVSPADLVFNLLEAPPPFSFAPTVSQFGSVQPTTGAATITGSVTCTEPAYVNIYGQLIQTHAGTPISGYFGTYMPCDGTTPWSATVQTQAALFHGRSAALFVGGKAIVAATASASDPDTVIQEVNLRSISL